MGKKAKATTFIEAWKEEFSGIYPEVKEEKWEKLVPYLKETYWDYLNDGQSLKDFLDEDRRKVERGDKRYEI